MDQTGTDVTVVVVTFRGYAFIVECLASLAGQSMAHDVLIVDNASSDGTAHLLSERFPQLTVLRQERNLGFAGAVAVALQHVRTRRMALLNDDAVAEGGWLQALTTALDNHPAAAAATSRMMLSQVRSTRTGAGGDAPINNLGVALTADGYGYDIGLGRPVADAFVVPTEVFGFSGGAALLDTALLRDVGGSPARFFLYYEDVDMAWRLRLGGHEIISAPDAVVHHRHSATTGQGTTVFHLHNERNRLLTLLRCAPLSFAIVQCARFVLTTLSLAARKLLRREVADHRNFSIRLRLRVLGAVVVSLPRTAAERKAIGRRATVARRRVAARWLGHDPLTGGGAGQPT